MLEEPDEPEELPEEELLPEELLLEDDEVGVRLLTLLLGDGVITGAGFGVAVTCEVVVFVGVGAGAAVTGFAVGVVALTCFGFVTTTF